MNGVLVIDKPAGPTSFDVVRRVRSLTKTKKAGHTGTLDPLATGVLPICLGDATRVAGYITEGDKAYDAVVRLGQETDTLDAAGKVTHEAKVPALTAGLLEEELAKFRGELLQTPPMYSAVKVGGRRLYELARAGEEVEREPRKVVVYELVLRDFSASELTLSVRCSKGFFVRTLAQDLGRSLGCGAHLKALRRTASGPFSLAQALPLDKLAQLAEAGPAGLAEVAARLVPISQALVELPAVTVSAAEAAKVAHGVPLETAVVAPLVRVVGPAGELLALAAIERGRLKYRRVLI
ncbi:MAG: tRNA pseudouridine(55) synthase TruB [Myxococcaceae bacterium]